MIHVEQSGKIGKFSFGIFAYEFLHNFNRLYSSSPSSSFLLDFFKHGNLFISLVVFLMTFVSGLGMIAVATVVCDNIATYLDGRKDSFINMKYTFESYKNDKNPELKEKND